MKTTYKLHKLIHDLSSEDYHGMPDTFSSSQFKDLLDDEDVFIKKYIKKEIPRLEIDAFDVGNYFHTGILEPHKLKSDCVVYPGKVRRGANWEKFKAKHKGKAIVTQKQKDTAEGLVKAVKNSPVAQGYLVGDVEVSLFVELVVCRGRIFAPHFGKELTKKGWVDGALNNWGLPHYKLVVKVRADTLGSTYISDLKSTTGNARSNKSMREKIGYYQYELSAALYLDMFRLLKPNVREFWWIFASKDLMNSKTYEASRNNIMVGRAKYMKAIIKMSDCAKNNWETVDYPDILEPLPHELEWLNERDIDLV